MCQPYIESATHSLIGIHKLKLRYKQARDFQVCINGSSFI